MKTTRQIFALAGSPEEVQQVLGVLSFKGIRVFTEPDISSADVLSTYLDNKSIVCQDCDCIYGEHPIVINVANLNTSKNILYSYNYIDISDISTVQKQFMEIAVQNLCDIGDPKSNSSGLNGAPKVSECNYCNYYYKGIDSIGQKIIYESNHFIVLATLGEFIHGYPIIIPKKHVMSCAEFDKETMLDFLEVLDDVLFILKKTYKTENFLVWENGTGNGGKGKAKDSVVHSHVHVAPSNLTADKIELVAGFPLKEITTKEISKYTNYSYLMIKDGKKWRINDDPNVYIPRQFIRQLIAEEHHLKGDIWNWRTHPFIDKMQETYEQIMYALHRDWKNIPKRIKNRIPK